MKKTPGVQPKTIIRKKPTWTVGACPNCQYPKAKIDPKGVLWCPACGYSPKGCYT